jgi:hypothetical protein
MQLLADFDVPDTQWDLGWRIDWDQWEQGKVNVGPEWWYLDDWWPTIGAAPVGLNGVYNTYSWDEIKAIFDGVAIIKSFEINNNFSGSPVFVDDIRIWNDLLGDLKKGDGPSEYTNDSSQANYFTGPCPCIIDAVGILTYPAADLNVVIDGAKAVVAELGETTMITGYVRNDGSVDAWDVDLAVVIEKQPGMYPTAQPESYVEHLYTVKGDGGTRMFELNMMTWEPGAYRVEMMPSGLDECGWHVKQDPNNHGWPLLVDDSSDQPILWIDGAAVTIFVGVTPEPEIDIEITYPDDGATCTVGDAVSVVARVENTGVEDLENVVVVLDAGANATVTGTPMVPCTLAAGASMNLVFEVTTDGTGISVIQADADGTGVTTTAAATDTDSIVVQIGAAAGDPDPMPSIAAEISYPAQGQKFFKGYEFAVTAVLTNDGDEALSNVAATLSIVQDETFTTIGDVPVVATNMNPGAQQVIAWTVNAGSITGDCVMELAVEGSGSMQDVMDKVSLTVRIDPPAELTISAAPGGSIGITSDCYNGAGDYMFDAGATVAIKAIPDAGMQFAGWVGDTDTIVDVSDATTTMTVLGVHEVVAVFADSQCADLQELLEALANYLDDQITVQELLEVLARYLAC